jgi:hypothetical protein
MLQARSSGRSIGMLLLANYLGGLGANKTGAESLPSLALSVFELASRRWLGPSKP